MTAIEILALVRAAFDSDGAYPAERLEVNGADAVGTDAYPSLRDAWPQLVEALRSESAEVRIAAAYALAFVIEMASDTQSALDAAVKAAELPLERAAMIVAAGRLRGSIVQWRSEPPYSWDGVGLTAEAAKESSRVVKAALVIADLFVQTRWGRKVKPEIEVALRAVDGEHVGPWGDGDLGRFARAMLATCLVVHGHGQPHAVYGAPPPEAIDENDDENDGEIGEVGELIDPAEQAAIDAVQAAIAAAEAAVATKSTIAEKEVADPYTQERPVRAAAPTVELPGLHDVEWAGFEHAYGDARGVPAMIEALSSPDEGDRQWARDALAASINHQGSVYSASAPAVPFLVQLVARGDIDDRSWILQLLAGLAVHDPRWYLFHDLEDAASTAFAEVAAGGPTYVRLVGDPDPSVRSHAAYLLSFVTPPDGAAVAVKRALAMETNRYARSSMVLALGYLGRRTKSTAERAAIERYLDDDCMLIRASAAIAIAQIDREACSPRARAVLANTVTDTPPVTCGPWPWNEGNVAGFARIVRLGILSVDEMLDEADAAHARGDWQSGRDYAAKAFDRTLRDGSHGVERLWLTRELDVRQRRVLRFLVAISRQHEGAAAPQFPMDSLQAFGAGIVLGVDAVKRMIGDATGPLDREIEIDGLQASIDGPVPAWFAIDEVVGERAKLAALRAAFATIAPAERVPMLEDAMSGPFALWHSRARMDFADPKSYERENDYTSRFIAVAAALLGDCELVGYAYARTMAEEQLALEHPRSMRCLVAATVLAMGAKARGEEPPEIVDRLVLTDQAPAGTYRVAIRTALDLLVPERARRLLGDLPLYTYWAHRDPRGEVRRWYNGRGWDLVDLLAPADIVTKIDAAWREWQRHRAAGDDPGAQPCTGSSTHSVESKPGDDQPFPIARAIAVLETCGDAGRELRDQLQRSTSAPTMSTSL